MVQNSSKMLGAGKYFIIFCLVVGKSQKYFAWCRKATYDIGCARSRIRTATDSTGYWYIQTWNNPRIYFNRKSGSYDKMNCQGQAKLVTSSNTSLSARLITSYVYFYLEWNINFCLAHNWPLTCDNRQHLTLNR